jgi:hypothetical protein
MFAIQSGDDVSASDALRSLDTVLASARFRACPRLASFLRFVVMATLNGRGDRLKGYTIAIGALGRAESFDPQSDPIVRVEAVRLRRALARYYAAEGARNPVAIELPLGGYVPVFRRLHSGCVAALPLALAQAIRAMQRVLSMRVVLLPRNGARLPPQSVAATTAPNSSRSTPDGRQDQQAESPPAARARRSRAG